MTSPTTPRAAPGLGRRRFLTIAAGIALAGPTLVGRSARAASLTRWHGSALGATASITLSHPEAEAIIARALAEIGRLEAIFSLHRPESALARLNRERSLAAPPFELLDCLGLCRAVHRATDGRFDPTIQPLWQLHAQRHAAGRAPTAAEIAQVLPRIGLDAVTLAADRVAFARPGMALTLNGVAQGYIADRVALLLAAEGLTDILVETGELRALGGRPEGGDWPVTLAAPDGATLGTLPLREMALASSAPLGTTFDQAGAAGHILDPRSGEPAAARWRLVSVTAPQAALADALSTAFCLLDAAAIDRALAAFPAARLAHLA